MHIETQLAFSRSLANCRVAFDTLLRSSRDTCHFRRNLQTVVAQSVFNALQRKMQNAKCYFHPTQHLERRQESSIFFS